MEYADAQRLDARIALHQNYRVQTQSLYAWVLDQIRLLAGEPDS